MHCLLAQLACSQGPEVHQVNSRHYDCCCSSIAANAISEKYSIFADTILRESIVKENTAFLQKKMPATIALMHVTSWSESYPLRNSLMGVRGCRQVFVQSFHLSAFVLKRPALLVLERQSQEMRFFSPPKTTSVGRLFEGETQALNEEVTLACRWGLRRWRKANLQIVKRYVKVCSSSQSSFLTLRQSKRSWRLEFWARKCLKVIDTSTIDSRESQFRSSHRYARQSGEHFVGQFKSELFVEYKTRWRVGQLWAPAEGLTTSPPRTSCSCSVDGQFNELWSRLFLLYAGVIYTCTLLMWVLDYVINLEQLHFGPHLYVILVKFSFSKCSLLRHAA